MEKLRIIASAYNQQTNKTQKRKVNKKKKRKQETKNKKQEPKMLNYFASLLHLFFVQVNYSKKKKKEKKNNSKNCTQLSTRS